MPPDFGTVFYDDLITEVLWNRSNLSDAHCSELRRYYHNLVAHPEYHAFYRYNWLRRTEPLRQLVTALPHRHRSWRVLDAGCGVGTETLFCAQMRPDIEIWGVDLDTQRLNTARARKAAHERNMCQELRVHFREGNVFDTLADQRFDLVWTMEAISHIHPAEVFVRCTAESLGAGGHLIISDSHIINPAIAWRVWRLRRQGLETHTEKTTEAGETVPYAQERMFAVWQVGQMLRDAGFARHTTQLSIYLPPAATRLERLFSILRQADRLLNRIPVLRYLGGIYTISAEK